MSAQVTQVGETLLAIHRHRVNVKGSTRWSWGWTVYRLEPNQMPEPLSTFATLDEAQALVAEVTA